jgi:DNA-binding response OmpR family regulator
VLVIDDDESTTQTFARMLRLEGYEVTVALTAEAGLREVETFHPDAILLDLRMPVASGLVFLRRLRAHEEPRRTPVAVITGDLAIDESIASEIRERGAELYFKPVWLDDLIGIAQRLLHRPA